MKRYKSEIPQLRTRTEFSFKQAFGKVESVTAALKESECPWAAIVDSGGTWGHVRWAAAMERAGVPAGFGAEIVVPNAEGRRPSAWVIGQSQKSLYNFTSSAPSCEEDFDASGILRFAGNALTNPDVIDYVDINPASKLASMRSVKLAKKIDRPLVLTSDNGYATKADEDWFMAWVDNKKMTPQHLLSLSEFVDQFSFLGRDLDMAISNTIEAAERAGEYKLESAPIIKVKGNLKKLVNKGKKYRLEAGHISEWTHEYEKRLKRELKMIKEKEYDSYFIVVADLVLWAKERMLVGPARGSSAGSLVCYLLRITEVDPIPYGLLFERFIDLNRNDLPDIDIDFSDKKRGLAFGYLEEKYGKENTGHIGSILTLQPRTVMAHVGKKLSIPKEKTTSVINVLIEYSSGDSRYGKGLEDTLNNTQAGKDFAAEYPEAMIMGELENHASHTGVHAAGFIVSNKPVIDYCTVKDGVAQIDKKDAEVLNLLKIDALGLRTLGVIEDTGCVAANDLYDLKLDDERVFDVFNQHKFCGLFQFEGAAQRRVSLQIPIDDFIKIDHTTALSRPGPLGGGAANKYINRNLGTESVVYAHPSMRGYLSDTYGVVLYQEQVMKIVREIGDFSWEDTSTIRKAMSGRKGKEFFDRYGQGFVKGAAKLGIEEKVALDIWYEICNFGAWGMNKSHTCSYAMISYWCAYMKAYHTIDYAASCLRNAKDDDQRIEMLREIRDEGVPFTPFDINLSVEDWEAVDGKLIGGFKNLKGIGAVKAQKYVNKRDTVGLTEKDYEVIEKLPVQIEDLTPARTLWGDVYDNPEKYNIYTQPKEFGELNDKENAVVVCRLIRLERRDENEAVRIARRNGEVMEGDTLFLDMFVVDDSISKPILARVNIKLWDELGQTVADRAVPKKDWFLIRGRWLQQFTMMSIHKIKCLTNKEMFL